MVLLVCTAADLEEPLNSTSWTNPRLVIRSPLLTHSEIARWQDKLDELSQACGCSHGAIALCIFLILFIAYSLRLDPLANTPAGTAAIIVRAGIFIAGLIGSALAGKVFGLYLARREFRQACRKLQSRLQRLSPGGDAGFDWQPQKRVGPQHINAHSS